MHIYYIYIYIYIYIFEYYVTVMQLTINLFDNKNVEMYWENAFTGIL